MNAIEILGGILRGGAGQAGGAGGGIFKDIFGQGQAPAQKPQGGPVIRPRDIEQEARELEDMLGVGEGAGPRGGRPQAQEPPRTTGWSLPQESTAPPPLTRHGAGGDSDAGRRNDEALVVVRAMINAAKADGRLTEEEQRGLLERLGGASREAVEFLRREFGRPLDVREFAWSVPLGLEFKVYAASLAAIDPDTKAETDYLDELAHGLRLPPEVREHIHRRYGVAVRSR